MAAVPAAVMRYRLLELVELEPSHWCPRCALPSATRITLASIVQVGGVDGPLKLSTRLRCDEGHGWLPDLGV